MYSHDNQKLIGGVNALGGVPRRRLLQGAGALALAAIVRSTPVFAEPDDESERLGPFGPWSTPVNLGPVINQSRTTDLNTHPAISKSGLSLYISSTRPGGVNGMNLGNKLEIWVSQRASLKAPWGAPVNLDAFNSVPVINSIGPTYAPNFSTDGHLLFFSSPRLGGLGGADLYVSRRTNKHDDFGWQTPVNLGAVINSPQDDEASTYFEDEETGIIVLYFASTRPGGPVGSPLGSEHIYASILVLLRQ
jgi:hypothetical protein